MVHSAAVIEPSSDDAMSEAAFFHASENGSLICDLCNHHCRMAHAELGRCGVRENIGGVLYTSTYGRVVACRAIHMEKLPLFHYYPGSKTMAVAAFGCNFHCSYCSNYDLALLPKGRKHAVVRGRPMTPASIVALACVSGCSSIAYTYSEPTVSLEFVLVIARAAAKAGITNLFSTNGYIAREPLQAILPYLDAVRVDLKSLRRATYRRIAKAKLEHVLDTINQVHQHRVWLEVTTPVITTVNDSQRELRDIAQLIKSLAPTIPWHVARVYPDFKWSDIPVTSASSLQRAREIGLEEGLLYVYSNESPGNPGEDTCCPSCGCVLIKRFGYAIVSVHLSNGHCGRCGYKVEGVGMASSVTTARFRTSIGN